MSLAINHNLMASNTARNLNTHYGRLATSTQRLSSGLRINGAADDAAGLAIRELMRADVAALHQGVRNANDAISMIQVVDGALGIIDEKLIRMKELAEQAATGTYNSTQRLMIDSEFQAMASEINRIAMATDFNGIKLIDGLRNNTIKLGEQITENVHEIKNSLIKYVMFNDEFEVSPGVIQGNTSGVVSENKEIHIKGSRTINYEQIGNDIYKKIENNLEQETITKNIYTLIRGIGYPGGYPPSVQVNDSRLEFEILNPSLFDIFGTQSPKNFVDGELKLIKEEYSLETNETLSELVKNRYSTLIMDKPHRYRLLYDCDNDGKADIAQNTFFKYYIDPEIIKKSDKPNYISYDTVTTSPPIINKEIQNDIRYEKLSPENLQNNIKIHFGPMNDSAEDYYYIEKRDCTVKGLGLEDTRIETQENAQKALVTVNEAIVKKDQARAYYGAMQNRLENTVSNLTIQAENLQSSESRISDVDVATEMTNFVRNQILTQSAVAMLSQANTLPQMAMQLIGG